MNGVKRLEYVDIAKALAVFLVVLGLLLPHHNDVAAGEIGNFWGLDPAFVGAAGGKGITAL